jgi:hypothetical protein
MPQISNTIIREEATIPYPLRIIKRGEPEIAIVKKVQTCLNELGCGPLVLDGIFGLATEKAVKDFQLKFSDHNGTPLKVDGKLGPLTWMQLFGNNSVPIFKEPDISQPLLFEALRIATSEVGILEIPLGSNRGPRVDEYIRSVGLEPNLGSFPWCAAFIYWCFNEAAMNTNQKNPLVKTAGVLDHWKKARSRKLKVITSLEAKNNPSIVKPGHIFIISRGSAFGHTGLVKEVIGGKLVTIEGNTNIGGEREGIGVFLHNQRSIFSIDKGFIDYGMG